MESPIQLLISLPCLPNPSPSFNEVLFVENLVSFERMARYRQPAWIQATLVFASGFKGTAKRLRMRTGSSLYWQGIPNPLVAEAWAHWLYDEGNADLTLVQVSFYGDLDFSGMQILAQLRQSFPTCQAWRPGYTALLSELETGQGHAPFTAGKDGQIDPKLTGCSFADDILLPRLRISGRCVDQELWPTFLIDQ